MRALRVLLLSALLVGGAVLQTSLLSHWRMPGAVPDLVLPLVAGIGMALGPVAGSVSGFGGGLLLDILPPADGTLGRWAMVLTLIGWLAGRSRDTVERSAVLPIAMVALLAPLDVLGYAGLGVIFGDQRVTWAGVTAVLPAFTLYDVLLAPFLLPLVALVIRRTEGPGGRGVAGF